MWLGTQICLAKLVSDEETFMGDPQPCYGCCVPCSFPFFSFLWIEMWMQMSIQVAREPLWEVGEKQSIIYQWRRNGSKRILTPMNEYINQQELSWKPRKLTEIKTATQLLCTNKNHKFGDSRKPTYSEKTLTLFSYSPLHVLSQIR